MERYEPLESFVLDMVELGSPEPGSYHAEMLTDEILNEIDGRIAGRDFDAGDFYSALAGGEFPEWLNPLDFEANLAAAVSALDGVDGLLIELRQLSLTELQKNHVGFQFESDHVPESIKAPFWNKHTELSNLTMPSAYRESLLLRLFHKTVDLLDYSKAANFSAKRLFPELYQQYAVDPNSDQLSDPAAQLREPLRKMVLLLRHVGTHQSIRTLRVSLKYDVTNEAPIGYVTPRIWKTGNADAVGQRTNGQELFLSNFAIWLSRHAVSISEKSSRVQRIGISIKEKFHQTGAKEGFNDDRPQSWYVSMFPATKGSVEVYKTDGTLLGKASLLGNNDEYSSIDDFTLDYDDIDTKRYAEGQKELYRSEFGNPNMSPGEVMCGPSLDRTPRIHWFDNSSWKNLSLRTDFFFGVRGLDIEDTTSKDIESIIDIILHIEYKSFTKSTEEVVMNFLS